MPRRKKSPGAGAGVPTSLAEEREAQRCWRRRPEAPGVKWFDDLIVNEFVPPEEHRARQAHVLGRVVRFAAARVPYYREAFARLGIGPGDVRSPEDLPRLPLLTKREVQDHWADMHARALPRGAKPWGYSVSSGTTGAPVRILHTVKSRMLFSLLKQREYRWFRMDPSATLAAIRVSDELRRQAGGETVADGETSHLDGWPNVGGYFETGPYVGLSVSTPIEGQVAWLEEHRPGYLICLGASLEHLAFAFQDRPRLDGLRGLLAISQQITDGMRRRIEGVFGVPVHQNYGINEIGVMAARCAGGRYHVHTETCLVEIVDDEGRPCRAGEVGRIAVTAVGNPAMPLIRYDADDMAEVVEGPCPCGRTLPSFGRIVGRYRRYAFLPPGTLGYALAVREAMATMPPELVAGLTKYQLHQFRDRTFELRLLAAAPLPPAFEERVRQAWQVAAGSDPRPLEVVAVDHIPHGPGGKFDEFTSDFFPGPDSDAAPPAAPEPA